MFNSKRRANELAPLTLNDFRKFKASQPSKNPLGTVSSKPAIDNSKVQKQGSVNSPLSIFKTPSEAQKSFVPSEDENKVKADNTAEAVVVVEEEEEEVQRLALRVSSTLGVSAERTERIVSFALAADAKDVEENRDEEEKEFEDDEEEEDIEITAQMSIFDEKTFESTEENLKYMEETYGFFIPDKEFLTDLEGFIVYLGSKVRIGGLCLYCQKQLTPGRPCQNHMINKSHCKITYEEDIDMDEYEDFYDFSASWEEDGEEIEYDSDGEPIEKCLEISRIGELILPDGRTVGHRDLRIYYKQKYRTQDTRPSVLAQKREELLRLESIFGGLNMSQNEIQRLTDAQVTSALKATD